MEVLSLWASSDVPVTGRHRASALSDAPVSADIAVPTAYTGADMSDLNRGSDTNENCLCHSWPPNVARRDVQTRRCSLASFDNHIIADNPLTSPWTLASRSLTSPFPATLGPRDTVKSVNQYRGAAPMYIAMNNFKVAPGREADFEQQWRQRDSYLAGVPGFVEFALLKGDNAGEYASHTVWESREAFEAWTRSESFVKAHRQGSVAGILATHPELKTYEAVLVERPAANAR